MQQETIEIIKEINKVDNRLVSIESDVKYITKSLGDMANTTRGIRKTTSVNSEKIMENSNDISNIKVSQKEFEKVALANESFISELTTKLNVYGNQFKFIVSLGIVNIIGFLTVLFQYVRSSF